MPARLPVPASVWTKVFRRLVRQLEQDADLRRVVEPCNLRSWKGTNEDRAPFVPAAGQVILRLTPNPEGVDWYDPIAFLGTLYVMVEIAIGGLCIDDVADLWDRVVKALCPPGPDLNNELVSLGAETGQVVCSEPAFDPRPQEQPRGYFLATGRFHIRLLP